MPVTKLGHIGLTVASLERAERFYSEVFDFEAFFRVRRKTSWLSAQVGYDDADVEFCHMRGAGGLHLELLKYHNPHSDLPLDDNTYRPGNVHFNLWVDSIEEITAKVNAYLDRCSLSLDGSNQTRFVGHAHDVEATKITDGPQKGGRGYYMRDPDGHTIELWQPALGATFNLQPLSDEMEKIISGIQSARAKNNDHWCDLIRLAYRAAPEEARKLFRKIEAQDAEILKLAQSSADVRS